MEIFKGLFENKKQKILWSVYVLILFLKFNNPPLLMRKPTFDEWLQGFEIKKPIMEVPYRPDATAYWSANFSGFLVFTFILTLIFTYLALLFKNRK